MKDAVIMAALALIVVAGVRAADEDTTITPVKPRFKWVRDEQGMPLERDPLTPVGFVWPKPSKETGAVSTTPAVTGPKRQLVIVVEFISIGPKERFAKATGMQEFLEQGKEYTVGGKASNVKFKVERIEADKVIVNYEGEILEFSPKTIPEDLRGKQF